MRNSKEKAFCKISLFLSKLNSEAKGFVSKLIYIRYLN